MLHVEQLERRAGGFRLQVDAWDVAQGSYVVVIGPSGSGKTMLLETLAGLHSPSRGHVWLDGQEVTRLPSEKRSIGLVYQDCWLFPHLTVRQNIRFGQRYHRGSAGGLPQADHLAEMLHITHLLDRKPEGLSAGERQRVALARALAIRPRLLFLDEPLGTLDPVMREHVAKEILGCHRSLGMTTIHVTHDHTEARVIGDAAAVLLQGRLQQSGAIDDVFYHPRTPALARFLGCENLLEGRTDGTHVELGRLQLEIPSSHRGSVYVCIRPEDLQIEPDQNTSVGPDALPLGRGTLLEVSIRGSQVRVVVESGGLSWVGLVGRSDWACKDLPLGSPVALVTPVQAVHLIPLEAASCS